MTSKHDLSFKNSNESISIHIIFLGNICYKYLSSFVSDVEAVNKEVKTGTETTISCIITGLTQLATVTWHDNSDTELSSNTGILSDDEQVTTLFVDSTNVTSDAVYTCRVTSGQFPTSASQDTEVQLNVYGMLWYI